MYFTSGSDRAFEQLMQGKPTRIEYGDDWYLVGIRADDLSGLRVRI